MIQGHRKRPSRGQGTAIAASLFAFTVCSPLCLGQVPLNPQAQTVPGASNGRPSLGADRPDVPGPLAAGNASRLEHLREDERHKRIVADTARLVVLTNELKDYVEKASKDELSLDVVRKAAEIEKLARDVKERMKG
jgi:hypothetical protein